MKRNRNLRHSPYINRPDMNLRYHLVDPALGELIMTAETRSKAVSKALEYQKDRQYLDFVEVYDEELCRVYRVARSNSSYGVECSP